MYATTYICTCTCTLYILACNIIAVACGTTDIHHTPHLIGIARTYIWVQIAHTSCCWAVLLYIHCTYDLPGQYRNIPICIYIAQQIMYCRWCMLPLYTIIIYTSTQLLVFYKGKPLSTQNERLHHTLGGGKQIDIACPPFQLPWLQWSIYTCTCSIGYQITCSGTKHDNNHKTLSNVSQVAECHMRGRATTKTRGDQRYWTLARKPTAYSLMLKYVNRDSRDRKVKLADDSVTPYQHVGIDT